MATSDRASRAIGVLFSSLLIVGLILPWVTRPEQQQLRIDAQWYWSRQDYSQVDAATTRLLELNPKDASGIVLAADLAAHRHQDERAIELYSQVPANSPLLMTQHAQFGLAERSYQTGNLQNAERSLRTALELNPQDLDACQRLSRILYLEGRAWEARPYLETLVSNGRFIVDELVMLASTESWIITDPSFQQLHSTGGLFQLGMAKVDMLQNRYQKALQRLELVLQDHRELGEVQGSYGRLLMYLKQDAAFEKWQNNLPDSALAHPEVWYALGLAARERGDGNEAVRCLVSALRKQPFHRVANYQLAQELAQLGETELAEVFSERARRLAQVHSLAGELLTIRDPDMTREICLLLLDLGRNLEACGWADMVRRFSPEESWYSDVISEAKKRGLRTTIEIRELQAVAELPLFSRTHRPRRPQMSTSSPPAQTDDLAVVHFDDIAPQAGIDFRYNIGRSISDGMEHIFETTGGGVGVVDLDNDGYPDLYFAQAGNWKESHSDLPDQVYRNLGSGQFQDIAAPAGIQEHKFSQGVTVGDLNEDGWPDIYVCNLGHNSCFINNGDGTFTESAMQMGNSSDLWSLSAAIADLNGDQLPDLYVVNYLNSQEVAERSCKHEGQPRSCAPTMFSGAQDRLFLNSGDGHFTDVTEQSGIVVPDGKGLGILVADFMNNGIPEIYVGNDTVANFLFVQTSIDEQGIPRYSNEAVLRGLAYNDQGQVQATMGMATTDVNGDGRLDIFATNFYHDANTLYVQTEDHFFQENTRGANLYDSGFYMLGFGTQFVDSSRTGNLDIAVTNGHVDRTFATGEPDLMKPQLFRNYGTQGFREADSASIGSYFDEQMLGRGLAVLDWNNDGLQDLVVTHLDRPAALLNNSTDTDNHFLQLLLVGTQAPRIPIGASVDVLLSSSRHIQRQLIAGDGYQVRNDPRLLLGLGSDSDIDSVTIHWPGDHTEVFTNITSNQHWTIVQGQQPVSSPQ
jgi:tetratricopeptide (TPR) repeat protein